MKTFRNLAGLFLLLTGVLHIVMFFQNPGDPAFKGVMVFGIIYCIWGYSFSTIRDIPFTWA